MAYLLEVLKLTRRMTLMVLANQQPCPSGNRQQAPLLGHLGRSLRFPSVEAPQTMATGTDHSTQYLVMCLLAGPALSYCFWMILLMQQQSMPSSAVCDRPHFDWSCLDAILQKSWPCCLPAERLPIAGLLSDLNTCQGSLADLESMWQTHSSNDMSAKPVEPRCCSPQASY